MEVIKIGFDSLKISLTADESREYGLDVDDAYLGEKRATEIFSAIFAKAREKTDFDFSFGRVLVEIYQSRDGGCEIFVSRAEVSDIYKDRASTINLPKSRSITLVYRFETINDLLRVSRRMENAGYCGKSAVYHDSKKEQYYLSLDGIFQKELKYAFITEYGKQMRASSLAYIKEHCECICKKDGVKILSKLL